MIEHHLGHATPTHGRRRAGRRRDLGRVFAAVIGVVVLLAGGGSPASAAGETVTFGFVQDTGDSLQLTAVVFPSFTSSDVTVSTATFTFLVPAGTVLDPAVPLAPDNSGHFIDVNGSWSAFHLTPDLWAQAGHDAAELEGFDVYQMTMAPGSIDTPTGGMTAGQAFPLFSFRVPNDCPTGNIRVLINDEPIRGNLLTGAGFNVNNQFSATIDNQASSNLYSGNKLTNESLQCNPLRPAPPRSTTTSTTSTTTTATTTTTVAAGTGGTTTTTVPNGTTTTSTTTTTTLTGGSTAATGSNIDMPIGVGLALVAAGGGLLFATRRRNSNDASLSEREMA